MAADEGDARPPLAATAATRPVLGWRDAALAAVGAAAILFIANWTGTAVAALFDVFAGTTSPRAFAAGEHEALTTLRLVAYLLAFQLVAVILSLLLARHFERRGVAVVSFDWPVRGVRTLTAAIVTVVALALAYGVCVYLLDPKAFASDMGPFSSMMRTRVWWSMLLAAGIGAPIAEEVLFRGLIYGTLARSPLGRAPSAVLSAAAWAGLHTNYSLYGVIAITLIGIYLAMLRDRTGSLVAPIACHAAYNSLIMLTLAFAPESAMPV